MQVRPARIEDSEAIARIYNAEVLGSTVTLDLVPRSIAEQRAWISRHTGAHPAVVAVDEEVAGFGALSPYRQRPAYSTTVEDSVYVGDGFRGRGVGRLLLNELLRLGTGHGFHVAIARCSSENKASIALHRSCGFTTAGIEREVGRKFGKWVDIVVMQRML
ncbi:MAG: GNAT family N-acetyltransferase [Acidimicrobiales bacterium]